MKTISKLLLFTLVLLLVGLTTISATDNISDTQQTADAITQKDIATNVETGCNDITYSATTNNAEKISQNKTIEKNNNQKDENALKTAGRTTTVTNKTYEQFFDKTSTKDLIQAGDTIDLKGNFANLNFTIDKKITLTSSDKTAKLTDCTIIIPKSGSGSTISYLSINNSAEYTSGIVINNSKQLTIDHNKVEVCGLNSYALAANVNQSTISFNSFETHKHDANTERTHSAVVLSCSYYNNFKNNTVKSDGANCIYLSTYPASGISGGVSNYNNITGNDVYGANTGWSYTIQIMGSNNIASYNKVRGGFRGISMDGSNNKVLNNDVNAFNVGIYATDNSNVQKNNIHVSNQSTGITIGGTNVKVTNNTISTENGRAIEIQGSNVNIADNTITSTNSLGIHSKGEYSRINIVHNTINTKEEGILFNSQSSTKKVNHVLVDRNTVTSQADYAVNLYEAGARQTSDINVTVTDSNVLTSKRGKGLVLAYLKPANAAQNTTKDTNQTLTISSSNYNNYFTNEMSNTKILQNATIYLSGKFNNVNFGFDKKVHIIGKNCIINNGTITLAGDAHVSSINNVTINNNKKGYNVHGIEVFEVNNCKISNVKISNYAISESLGIFLFGSNGNTIEKTTITTSGDYLNNAILLYASDSNTLSNNKINVNQTNIKRGYDSSVMFNEKIGLIQEVLHTHGIILLYSSNNIIDKNTVTGTSMFKSYMAPTKDCQNSIVGIDIYFESDKNKVTNNNINIKSYAPFVYGMGVLGASWGTTISSSNSTDNLYENNQVTLQGGYFATGFIAGRNSVNTQIKSNTFKINVTKDSKSRGDYAFGITLENSTKSTINANTITTSGSALYNMELFDSSDNVITNNKITGTGTHPYAIAGYRTSNNKIQNNNITLRKVNYGATSSAKHSDAIPYGDEGIMLMSTSTNNRISGNKINTNATYTVKLTSETSKNNVTENSLVAKAKTGDKSVSDASSNKVSNNFIHFTSLKVNNVTAMIGDNITLTAIVTTTTKDYSNLTATFKLGTNTIGTSKVKNGKATLNYLVSTLMRPTNYQIKVTVQGTNFQNATSTAQATFIKGPEKTNVNVSKVLKTVGSNATLTATITSENGGKIGSGKAEFYLDNKKLGTVNVKLGAAQYVYRIASTAKSGVHTIKVIYLGTSDYKKSQATNILGIQTKSAITLKDHTAKLGDAVTIKANVKSGNKAVATGKAKIYIGTKNIATAKITNGAISYKYTVPSTFNKNTYTLKIVYDGNNTLSSATKSAKIKINPYTPVFKYNTTKVIVGSQATLRLKIDNGKTGTKQFNAASGNVTIKLNGKVLKDSNNKVIAGTPKNGTITFKFTAPQQLAGKQNITFTFSGNNKFSSLTKTYTNGLVIEKLALNITIKKIANVKYGEKVTVSGKFTDQNGKLLKNTNLKIKINTKTVTVKTDANAEYKYTAKTSVMGINNVSVSFEGNAKYDAKTTKTTFKVLKQDVKITVNSIKTVKYGEKVNITGKLTDKTGQIISNANIKVSINGKIHTAKTNNKGVYTLTPQASVIGTNNVTVTFASNTKYNSYTSKASFKVVK
ncbi:MAG: hypothetical protein BZ138_03920 [Methanosphaera sp. rholeuAM270]|nr:MAG: hypothetical protein BZ138_03920 [Methanosphaera sp. rholeuAM270]